MKPSSEDTHAEKPATSLTDDLQRSPARGAESLKSVGFDVDAWEPSLLERMLRTVRRRPDSSG